jgi:nucleoside-diphosphate-sugar epimerase
MVRRPEQADQLRDFADEVVIADLTKAETLAAAAADVAGVYHIGAVFRQDSLSDAEFHDINAEGVRRMLDASIAAGVPRFVHCSTNGVHSDIETPPADETAPFNPGDIYQETKLAGELIAMDYFKEGKIGGVVIRPTMIYGPGDKRTLKLFRMIAKKRFFYVGPGNALAHWVDVRDLAHAFWLAMEAKDINAEVFLIGGKSYLPLREIVREIATQLDVPEPGLHLPVAPVMAMAHLTQAICKPIGIEPPLFPRRVYFYLKNRAYDISKAHDVLGFEPRQDFAGEISDIIAAYREDGSLPKLD